MKVLLSFSFLCLYITLPAQESLVGIWNTGNENTKIEITADDGVYFGTIISSDKADAKIGNQLLKDVKSVQGEWKGKLYSPKKGKWYDATITENGNILEVQVKAGLAKKTLEWTKEIP